MMEVKEFKIIRNGQEMSFPVLPEKNVFEQLRENGIFLSGYCAGKGICGKCKIKLVDGFLGISEADKKFFSEAELEAGYRLACKAYIYESCTIEVFEEERSYEIVTDYKAESEWDRQPVFEPFEKKKYSVCIDIGTTTVAAQLLNLSNGAIEQSFSALNMQRVYGADVISRIQASNEGGKRGLQRTVQKQLKEMIENLVQKSGITPEQIKEIVISANTTMLHLLCGFSCRTLGIYPFTPVSLKMLRMSSRQLLEEDTLPSIPVVLLPGISAFIGADIVSGLFSCGFYDREELCLFLDLGTNAEMAIGNNKKILCTSAAAGPVFEGGNIKCGTGSVFGAISQVSVRNKSFVNVKTIGNKFPPAGICGTGLIEAIAELKRNQLLDETGYLETKYQADGFLLSKCLNGSKISIFQEDIREFQMAKSAICSGLEILLKEYKASYEEIHTLYLAGGFGYRLEISKAAAVGLLPKALENKVVSVGNSSLQGAVRFALEEDAEKRLENIISFSKSIQLSENEKFQELYIKNMNL